MWSRACVHQSPGYKSLLILTGTEGSLLVKGLLIPSLFWFKSTEGEEAGFVGTPGHSLVMKPESVQLPPGQQSCGLASGPLSDPWAGLWPAAASLCQPGGAASIQPENSGTATSQHPR